MPDGRLSALHFNADKGVPRLIFAHANGFNGLAYRRILNPLGVHAIALDLRGHGFSELPTNPQTLRNWHIFADDIVTFFRRHIEAPVLLAGHSYGGTSSILAAPDLNEKITGLIAFDPPTLPAFARFMSSLSLNRALIKRLSPLIRNTGRRRHLFESREQALERYKGRGIFKHVSDDILSDYLDGGLIETDKGVKLACDPAWEQAIFMSHNHDIFTAARSLPENCKVIYAEHSPVSRTSSRASMQKIISERYAYEAGLYHLFPFHEPEIAITYLKAALSREDRE